MRKSAIKKLKRLDKWEKILIIFFLICLIIGVLTSCTKQAYIEPPRAMFTINLTQGTTETIFVLDASKSTPEVLYKVNWGFGFSEYTKNPIFENKYSETGEFVVTLRVKLIENKWTDDCKRKIEIK